MFTESGLWTGALCLTTTLWVCSQQEILTDRCSTFKASGNEEGKSVVIVTHCQSLHTYLVTADRPTRHQGPSSSDSDSKAFNKAAEDEGGGSKSSLLSILEDSEDDEGAESSETGIL